MWWLIPIAIGALIAGALTLDAIQNWFRRNRTDSSAYGELIKERLASGDYRIVAGVINVRGKTTASREWTTSELSPELEEAFDDDDYIVVDF